MSFYNIFKFLRASVSLEISRHLAEWAARFFAPRVASRLPDVGAAFTGLDLDRRLLSGMGSEAEIPGGGRECNRCGCLRSSL